jgi:hypothetical protein
LKRRSSAAQLSALLGTAAWLAGSGASAGEPAACGADLAGAARAESARYTVAYRTRPDPLKVSQHFAIELAVCAKPGASAPDSVEVDARMPEHGHGMSYRARVRALGEGRYRAEGLMFHMPGRWELVFDVRGGGSSEQALSTITLR